MSGANGHGHANGGHGALWRAVPAGDAHGPPLAVGWADYYKHALATPPVVYSAPLRARVLTLCPRTPPQSRRARRVARASAGRRPKAPTEQQHQARCPRLLAHPRPTHSGQVARCPRSLCLHRASPSVPSILANIHMWALADATDHLRPRPTRSRRVIDEGTQDAGCATVLVECPGPFRLLSREMVRECAAATPVLASRHADLIQYVRAPRAQDLSAKSPHGPPNRMGRGSPGASNMGQ
ncbi:hypothetical protein B0H15DRAFT_948893 [Mycena belliarum]|uniref:Uncharacterized protein n=1 Tax=Mycena belliarum TaxID=1033014 RepID=A0AAD6XPX0_9AGAR|nr:hypothetical protein B0H15DRAFT_948893 [Mycena belliae]